MSRRKGSDKFGFSDYKSTKGINPVGGIAGANNASSLKYPQPVKYRFRPPLNSKNFSEVSNYNYASLWSRWRRGYELSMWADTGYTGRVSSAKVYVGGGTPDAGTFVGSALFEYPTTRTDAKAWVAGIRPRDSYNFYRLGNPIVSSTPIFRDGKLVYAVVLQRNFGPPVTFFQGEVMLDRIQPNGLAEPTNYGAYTVVGVGIDGVFYFEYPTGPEGFLPIYNTLFLSGDKTDSWQYLPNALAIPALQAPRVGNYLSTEMRSQCTCPDFLGREPYDLWNSNLYRRYPFTQVNNITPGFFDAGSQQRGGVLPTDDDPGYVRTFGFLYLNEIYNIAKDTEAVYSSPQLFYFAPRWCKHIYCACWQMKRQFGQSSAVDSWVIPEPNDELLDERYKLHFETQLAKEFTEKNLEKNLLAYERYSPNREFARFGFLLPNQYNVVSKTLNFGRIGSPTQIQNTLIQILSIDEYNPFESVQRQASVIITGGTYANGRLTSSSKVTFKGGPYRDSVLRYFPKTYRSMFFGGVYNLSPESYKYTQPARPFLPPRA